jgi:hypothetical protein
MLKHTVVPRVEHLHDESVRYSCILVSVQLYPYPRAAPRHYAYMKLLLHAMRMLAARACMVAAGSIRTFIGIKKRSHVSKMVVRKHHLLVGVCGRSVRHCA